MDNKFTLKFRGTRGSYPTAKKDFLKYGGNTSSIEVRCDNQLIILDAGTGIIETGNDISKKQKDDHKSTIVLSHIHQDHIQGLQFFKPLFKESSKINLFGLKANDENIKDSLKNILFDKVFPLSLEEIKSDFKINNFNENNLVIISQKGDVKLYDATKDSIIINDDDIVISAYKTNQHPKYGCLCIKIQYKSKTLVYATDKESIKGKDEKFIDFAKNCDCLIHDAQYTSEDYNNPDSPKYGFGHSTFEMAIETAEYANAKKLFFFHYDPEYNDKQLDKLEKKFKSKNIMFAKENLEIKL